MPDAPVLTAPRRFPEISPKAYEHPADRAATAALAQIPMLDTVVGKLVEFGYERAYRQSFLASAVRLSPTQLPVLHASYLDVVETLDMREVPDLYLAQDSEPNAMAIGVGQPLVVVLSGLVELLDEAELKSVLAHEAGHVLSGHLLYRTALLILLRLTSGAARVPGLATLPLMAVQVALLEWFRASELSSDRAAALVMGDPRVVCRTLMHLSGGRPQVRGQGLDVDAFLAQAGEYEAWDSAYDRVSRLWRELGLAHSYPVRRAQEVMRWVRSGDYDRIMSGDYPKRGDPVDARAQASDAADHYAERFSVLFKDLGDGLTASGQQVADWLRSAAGR